jgi:hypothetical protein
MKESDCQTARSATSRVLSVLALSFGIYLTGFGLIVVDEIYLETRVIAKHAPSWVEEGLKIIYWPILHTLE